VFQRGWRADDLNRGEFRWHPNPAWDDLRFELDVIDGVPRSILRSGSRFERSGNDVYVFQREFFIRAERDANDEISGWRWYDRRGEWISYDAEGRIASYGDRNGPTARFLRDSEGRIEELRDRADALIARYTWQGAQLRRITDRADRHVEYHYSGEQLTRVVDVLGYEWQYGYQGRLLHTLTDPEGRVTTVHYSGNRVVRMVDAALKETTYSYTYDRVRREYTVVMRSPDNVRSERRYDFDGRLINEEVGSRVQSQLLRDGEFVEISIDERGLRTRTELDANRNPVRVLYPDGSQTQSRFDGTYGNLLEHTNERGVRSTYEYDPSGRLLRQTEAVDTPEQRVTEFVYNEHGERTQRTVKGTTVAEDVVTDWTYDAYGNVETVTDGERHTTHFTHHVSGVWLTRRDPLNRTWTQEVNAAGWVTAQLDPMAHRVEHEYDKVGNRTATIDAARKRTEFEYDALDRLEKTIDPLGGEQTTVFSSDGEVQSRRDETGAVTTYRYDAEGRLETITDAAGNVTRMVYGDNESGLAGLLVSIEYPTYQEEYRYDLRSRRTSVSRLAPDGGTIIGAYLSSFDAAGNLTASVDPAGRAHVYIYDSLGRLTATISPDGSSSTVQYDVRDNIVEYVDAAGGTHLFEYDRENRVILEARPNGGRIFLTYDSAGRVVARRSASGERAVFVYDDADNKIEERLHYSDAFEPSEIVQFDYDPRGLLEAYTQVTDPGTPQQAGTAATYTYSDKGEKTGETITYRRGSGAGAVEFSHSLGRRYRANGQLEALTYPDGTEVAYGYDPQNRLTSAGLPDGGQIQWSQWQWQQPTRVVMPGAVRTLEFDGFQRPTRIRSQAIGDGSVASPSGAVIMDYRYRFDATGNVTQRETEDGAFNYGYDLLDRLTAATPPPALQLDPAAPESDKLPVEAYSYDPVHNRLSSQHQPGEWRYNADNQLLGYGLGSEQVSFAYNANGHTERETTGDPAAPLKLREYRYNAAERLVGIDENGQALGRYRYDPMGRRVYKETATETTWFVYADEGLVAELRADGSLKRAYGWKPQGFWGTNPLWMADRGLSGEWATRFYHNDRLYTPQKLSDLSGAVSWSGLSEVFGSRIVADSAVENPLAFPGQYVDIESGLHYNWTRYYSPTEARYIQSDLIGIDGGENFYVYALSQPTMLFDETGEHPLALVARMCIRFPRACASMALCRSNPAACRELLCGTSEIAYHWACDIAACTYKTSGGQVRSRTESCVSAFLRTSLKCTCYVNRLLSRRICRPNPANRDKSHRDQIRDAKRQCADCLEIYEKNCDGDCR
jgi:RHS repeat-associated protein